MYQLLIGLIPHIAVCLEINYMQKAFYFVAESATMAMKGYRILNRNGINARVERTLPAKNRGGCGYSIVVYGNPQKALEILNRNNIKVKSAIEK